MSAHVHAALMAQYAQDALTTDKPWELWEYKSDTLNKWYPMLSVGTAWQPEYSFRRKPERQWYRVSLCGPNTDGSYWTSLVDSEEQEKYFQKTYAFVRWLTDRVYYDVE